MLDYIIREAGIDLTDSGIELITSGLFPETVVVKRGSIYWTEGWK